jgi:hypothetical protein
MTAMKIAALVVVTLHALVYIIPLVQQVRTDACWQAGGSSSDRSAVSLLAFGGALVVSALLYLWASL